MGSTSNCLDSQMVCECCKRLFPSLLDVTPVLRNGHWPSYNVPYFEDIYKLSGYPAVVKEKGRRHYLSRVVSCPLVVSSFLRFLNSVPRSRFLPHLTQHFAVIYVPSIYRQTGWIGTVEVNRDTCLKCLSWPQDHFKQMSRFISGVPISRSTPSDGTLMYTLVFS